MRMSLLTAKASTTEEPREGKLHAGICVGDAGQPEFLPRLCQSQNNLPSSGLSFMITPYEMKNHILQ